MKKIFLCLSVLFVFAAVSCQKDDQLNFISAAIERYHASGKVYVEDNVAHWNTDDTVSINGYDEKVRIDGNEAQISLSHPDADCYYALFPARISQSFSNNQYSVVLPSIQELRTDSEGRQLISGVMAAVGSNSLQFRNLTSLLCLQLPTSISVTCISVVARNSDNEIIPLCGNTTVGFSDGVPSLGPLSNGDSVMLVCPPQYRANRSRFYIVLPPVKEAKLTIRVTFICNGKICSKSFSQSSATNIMPANAIANVAKNIDQLGEVPVGRFSISSSQKVCFSQGNLQYIGSAASPYWKFADNQYDFLGSAQGSTAVNIDRDLFGWGTSGATISGTTLHPYLTTTDATKYFTGNVLTDQSDWGKRNTIRNGGTGWYTLSQAQWNYLLFTRASSYAKATVNNVPGVVLLPDGYHHPLSSSLNGIKTSDALYSSNTISLTQWILMESQGAVFLPAAGYRYGTTMSDVNFTGRYWASDLTGNALTVYCCQFSDGTMNILTRENYYGHAVRLVHSL